MVQWRETSMDEWTIKTPNPICRLFFIDQLRHCIGDTFTHGWYFRPSLWTVAPMDKGTILVYCCPSTFFLTSPPSPLPKLIVQFIQTVCGCGGVGVGGVELCCIPYSSALCFWPDLEPTKLLHHPRKDDIKGLVSLKFLRPCLALCVHQLDS